MSDEREDEPQIHDEPARERALGERLRRAETRLYGEAPDDIRAAALRARLLAAARPALSRRAAESSGSRAGGRSWWEYTARWGRAAIPAGLAAAAAAILLVIGSRKGTADMLDASSAREQTSMVAAAVSGASSPEVAEAFIGPATREWLISAAFASGPASTDPRFIDSARR